MRPRSARALRNAARLCAIAALAWGAHELLEWTRVAAGADAGTGLLIVALLAYAALIALPFAPGVEIGVALLAMEGAAIAPAVYAATTLGLMAAFLIGSHPPWRGLLRVLQDLGLNGAARRLDRVRRLNARRRLALLRRALPRRVAPHLLRHRYLLLALLFNLPGNAVLGGGGGIAALAGLSGVFATAPTALTIALAVAPVPLMVYVFDMTPIW